MRKKGIINPNVSGDGTGYSLTISKHYASVAAKEKDNAKEAKAEPEKTDTQTTEKPKNTKKAFVFSFKWIDNKTKMYISYGASLKSEKETYDKANEMLATIKVKLNSVRLDRYYSCSVYVDGFDKNTKVYVIPKKNATLNGGWHWKRTMIDFVKNTPEYLEQYYQRENSEASWSADKKHFGWDIVQRRPDRIDTADFCTELWHNLFQLGATN